MFSLKNLIFQFLVLTIIAASLTNCSPSNRLSKEVSSRRRSESATEINNTTASASTSTSPGFEKSVNILDKAQFEASGLTLIIPRSEKPEGDEASGMGIIIPRSEKSEGDEASDMRIIIPRSEEPKGDGLFICETSVASPWVWNSRRLADWFSNFNGWYCCNRNVNGGGCSHLMTIEDASTAICGREGCIRCEDVASNVNRIVEYCQGDNKAGGVSFLDQGSHIVLY